MGALSLEASCERPALTRQQGCAEGLCPSDGSLRVSLSFFLSSPKIVDPPQEEWGIKGVENRLRDDAGVHSPPCRLSVVKTTGS